MKKKIVIFLGVIVALLPFFTFSTSADTPNITYLGAYRGSSMVGADVREAVYIVSGMPGYQTNTAVMSFIPNVSGDVQYNLRLNTISGLATGDLLNFRGLVAVPQGTTSLDFYILNSHFTTVTQKQSIQVNYGVGGSNQTFFVYEFSFDINYTSSSSYSGNGVSIIVRGTKTETLIPFSMSYALNNNPSVALDNQADKINQGTQNSINSAKNETYGYSKKSSNNTDSGLRSGSSLLDSLSSSIDSFNDNVDSSVNNLLINIDSFKSLVHSCFDIFPDILQYLLVFSLVFLVVRKVVGR